MPNHRIQHLQQGCCSFCPPCTSVVPVASHSTIRARLLGGDCINLRGEEFDLVFNSDTNEWESGDITFDCSADLGTTGAIDTWNIKARCKERSADPNTVLTSCCESEWPAVLLASFSDLAGCPGPWPTPWQLTWNGSAWVGTSTDGCDTISLTLTCPTGPDCNGFRLAISSTCQTGSDIAPTTCSCDNGTLTFDFNFGASGCSPCCDGSVLRTARLTITGDSETGTGSFVSSGEFIWQWNATNSCGLSTGWVDEDVDQGSSCHPGTLGPWDASGCECCLGPPVPGAIVNIEVVDDKRFSVRCCLCVCDTLCAVINVGEETECCGTIRWTGCSIQTWEGTVLACAGADIDLTFYLRESMQVGTGIIECAICLESECLGYVGEGRLCADFVYSLATGGIDAVFNNVDFNSCIDGTPGSGTIIVSCGTCRVYCGCCQVPDTLVATLANVTNCSGVGGVINLVYDSDSDSWIGNGDVGTGGASCPMTLELFCDSPFPESVPCTSFRLRLTSDCVTGGESILEPSTCDCVPFELEFAAGASDAGCDCCDGLPLPGTFSISITE